VPVRLSFAAIKEKEKAWAPIARRAGPGAGAEKPEISEIPAAWFRSRVPSNAGLRYSWESAPRRCSRPGHFDLQKGATRGGNENVVGTLSGTIKAVSSPRRARAINRL
jgi:hypothetical protein